jgi:phosphohistidine swiveling domain-containing protein
MAELQWDAAGDHLYETGVSKGVLYRQNGGVYDSGYAWNGLTGVTESPSGAEPTAQYADNIKYLNLLSQEEFGGTIEAFTYPDEFGECDGSASPEVGVTVGQQPRKVFGLSYQTKVGNDLEAEDYGYKIHLVYGALAAPSEKAFATINDTPEAITFSWEFSTTPVPVTGARPTSLLVIDSTKVDEDSLAALEDALYGTVGADPYLPMPDDVLAMFAGDPTVVVTEEPSFVSSTGVITIPTVTGVVYRRADTNAVVTGTVTISTPGDSLVIKAFPSSGAYAFSSFSDNDWTFTRDE